MTADDFSAASIALLRSSVGWQSAIARKLAVESRTVRRWVAAGETPAWVDAKLKDLMGVATSSPWPRDEWLIGDAVTSDGRRREYIAHLAPPRFVARIVACEIGLEPEADEWPVDTASGAVCRADDETLLCEVDWIDEVSAGQVTQLMEAAAMARRARTRNIACAPLLIRP